MNNKIKAFIAALFGLGVVSVAGAGILTPGSGGGILSQMYWTSKGSNIIAPGGSFTQDLLIPYRNIIVSSTLALTDTYESVNTASGSITLTLPLFSTASLGQLFFVKDRTGNATTSNITIVTATSTDKIDGATSTKINSAFGSLRIVVGATGWEVN